MTDDRGAGSWRRGTLPSQPRVVQQLSDDYMKVRLLDPTTAYQLVSQKTTVLSTAYRADSLLIRGGDPEVLRRLRELARDKAGYDVDEDDLNQRDRDLLDQAEEAGLTAEQRRQLDDIWVTRVFLTPRQDRSEAFRPIDTWRLLQDFRAEMSEHDGCAAVSLEHPATSSAPRTDPHPRTDSHAPRTDPHPRTDSHRPRTDPHPWGPVSRIGGYGLDDYSVAGGGGRQPVTWVGQRPVPSYDVTRERTRRPVVAVLDTRIGEHPWLDSQFVTHDVDVLGTRIGIEPRDAAGDLTGVGEPLLGWLDEDAGHGTFIAGLVRQRCPEAEILDIPLYGNDGVVEESAMLRTLQLLVLRQMLAVNGHCRYQPVDVLSLSLGYYHEQPDDPDFDPLLRGPIEMLGRYGVAVVVSAGNDATERPAHPAAFAPYDGSPYRPDPDVVPVLAVGALNPNGTTALFSNEGPWVKYMRRGAALVSTFPTTYNGSRGPEVEVETDSGVRQSMDPDDFSSGFGVWSGTSFAAPVLAGELAAVLAAEYRHNEIDRDSGHEAGRESGHEADQAGHDVCAAVTRMRRAIATLPTRPRHGRPAQ